MSFFTAAVQSSTPGVFSHSSEGLELPTSFSLKFNMSLLERLNEDIRYAYISVSKSALSMDKLEYIKNQCNPTDEGIRLELLVKVNASQDRYSPLTTAVLTLNDLGKEKTIEFGAITNQFKVWVDEIATSKTFEIIDTKIIVRGNCYNHLNPSDLGIGQDTRHSSYIIVFSKSDDSEEAIIKAGLAELAAEATAARQARSADDTPSRPASEVSNSTTFNITNYYLHPCQKYSHTVSRVFFPHLYLVYLFIFPMGNAAYTHDPGHALMPDHKHLLSYVHLEKYACQRQHMLHESLYRCL